MLYLVLNYKTRIAKVKSNPCSQSIASINNFKVVREESGTTIFNDFTSIWWPNNRVIIYQYE